MLLPFNISTLYLFTSLRGCPLSINLNLATMAPRGHPPRGCALLCRGVARYASACRVRGTIPHQNYFITEKLPPNSFSVYIFVGYSHLILSPKGAIMRAKLSTIIICLFSLVLSLNAAVAITGTVKDQATQTPIRGAIVSLAAAGLTCITDSVDFIPLAYQSRQDDGAFITGYQQTVSRPGPSWLSASGIIFRRFAWAFTPSAAGSCGPLLTDNCVKAITGSIPFRARSRPALCTERAGWKQRYLH